MNIKNRDALYKALQTKIGDKPCPLCSKLSGFYVEFPEHQIIGFDRTPSGLNLEGEHYCIPCVTVICKNCGCAHMISLQVLLDDPNYITSSLEECEK